MPDELDLLKNQVNLLNEALDQANRIRDRWQESTTALKESRKQLEESRQHYHSIMLNAFDAILITDMHGAILEYNPAATRLFGYESHELMKLNTTDLFDETELIRQLIDTENGNVNIHGSVIEATGISFAKTYIPLEITVMAIDFSDAPHALLTLRDISSRKEAKRLEVQTREALEVLVEEHTHDILKLSRAIEQSTESIIITDRSGTIEYVNAAFTRISGFSAEEAIGKNPRILKSSHYDEDFYHNLWDTILAGQKWEHKIIDRRKDGEFFHARLSISPIFDDQQNITHFIGIKQDLTDFDRIEDQFHQAQKLEAVGTLAGGIAHEFNNILAGLTGNLYLSRSQCQGNTALQQRISRMEGICLSAADMIRQLLTFARQDCQEDIALNLSILLKETFRLAKVSIPEYINLQCKIESEHLNINGDAALIQQIILNLINNARDAVTGVNEPQVSIMLSSFDSDSIFLARHPDSKHHKFAMLQIQDNGSGISAVHLEHIFDPFFTTKPPGEGTGLGLSMIHGAVERYEGHIDVKSEPGKTCFNIYLPLRDEIKEVSDSVSIPVARKGNAELILLVDDEPRVRAVTAEILRSLNFEVIEADDGIKACELSASMGSEISLIIMDVIMPRLGGIEAACNIRQTCEQIPIIFMTGYSNELSSESFVSLQRVVVLNKPCSIEELTLHIHQLLPHPE